MRSAAEGLEPAEVEPKQLWKTAGILVALMLFGGFGILIAYNKAAAKQSQDFRPPFINELKGHVLLQLSDGEVVNTSDIEEDVWVFYQTTFAERETHTPRDLAFAEMPDGVRQVEFFVDMDPNSEADRAQMATLEKEPGVWKVAAKAKVLEKLLKANLRFGTIPHQKDGKWIYDNSVAVLKRDEPDGKNVRIHVRGEIFDFEKAEEVAQKAGDPSLAKGFREDHFLRTIKHLLNEGDPTQNS